MSAFGSVWSTLVKSRVFEWNVHNKKCPYDFRDTSILERSKSNTTKYGLKSFRNYGAKIWNLLPNNCKSVVSLGDFKNIIKSWNGPSYKCPVCSTFFKLVLLFSNCCTSCSVSNVIPVYLTISIRLFYVCVPFYSLYASMGNGYKLSTLLFTPSFLHNSFTNCKLCYVLFPCECHCFYSCRIIADLSSCFCFDCTNTK